VRGRTINIGIGTARANSAHTAASPKSSLVAAGAGVFRNYGMVIPPGGSLPISRAGSPPVAIAETSNRKQEIQNMPRTPIINALTINVEGYFHPWEIDHEPPRIPGIDLKTRFRHYLNLQRTEGRLRRLLGDFHWGRMGAIFLPSSGGEAG
jgi:hypothetical protein